MKYLFAVFLLLSVNLSAQQKQDNFYLTIKITGIKKITGIPKEGFAFSNNIKPRFTAPKFRDCKIDVKKNVITEIRLIYY